MRSRLMVASTAVMLALQGCAGTTTVFSRNEAQSLESIQLFKPDGSPRFAAYVACTSEDGSCSTAEKVFSKWADDRHIALSLIEPDDALFKLGIPSFGKRSDLSYRLAIQFEPHMAPGVIMFSGGQNAMGSYTRPKVGYHAKVYVFDALTGTLLQQMPVHEEVSANPDDHANANGYIESEVVSLIDSLDPGYSRK